jgi:hypothetical protein
MYAKIACNLRFNELDPSNISTFPFSFFVCVPNKLITVQNSTGNNIVLNTFHRDHDWWNTDDQAALNTIWDHHKSFGKPFTLAPPAISLDMQADAVLNDCTKQLEKLALEAAWRSEVLRLWNDGSWLH